MNIIKKIEDLFNRLGEWNHAVVALFMVPVFGILTGSYIIGGFMTLWGYYNREVSSNDSYNPMKWLNHDYIQSGILFICTPVIVIGCLILDPVIRALF